MSTPFCRALRPAAALTTTIAAALVAAMPAAPAFGQTGGVTPGLPPAVSMRAAGPDGLAERFDLIRVPDAVLPAKSITLAQDYWLEGRLGAAGNVPQSHRIHCYVGPDGILWSPCFPVDARGNALPASAAVDALIKARMPLTLRLPRSATPKQLRRAEMTLHYVPTARPPLNWDSAPLAPAGTRMTVLRVDHNDYPLAALRAGVQADIRVECMVLADQSVTCRTLSIDSPAPQYFNGWIESLYPRARVAKTLADGTPTAGMRVQQLVRMLIPD